MKTRYVIPLVLCVLWLCGALYAADELPVYPGAALAAKDVNEGETNYACALPKDAKSEEILAFYQDKLKLSEWKTSITIDAPWLYLRSFTKDGRAFGLAVFGEKMLLLDSTAADDRTMANWVRTAVLVASPGPASIDASEIPYAEYYNTIERLPYQESEDADYKESGLLTLKRLVTERLLLKMAKEKGVGPTDEQIADRIARFMKMQGMATMLRTGITESDMKERMRVEQAAYNIQTKGVTVTPEEIGKLYKTEIANFTIPKMVYLAGIFVKSKEDANKVMALLKTNVEFGEVAKSMSVHESAMTGGTLAPLPRNAEGVPEEVKKTIFSTPVGKNTQPIDAGDQWIIFKVLKYDQPKVTPLAEVEDQIRDNLMLKKGMEKNANVNQELAKLRAASDIKVFIKRYEPEVLNPAEK